MSRDDIIQNVKDAKFQIEFMDSCCCQANMTRQRKRTSGGTKLAEIVEDSDV